jgi:hypothetical protein
VGRIGLEGIRSEAIIVGDGDRFVLIVIVEHVQRRPEDLVSSDGHLMVTSVKKRGPDEISPEPIGIAFAAGDQSRARLNARTISLGIGGSRALVRSTDWRPLERRLATALTAANNA